MSPSPSATLFRPEAIAHHERRHHGSGVVYLQPVAMSCLVWLLVAATAAVVAFAATAGYARKETVEGYLAPTAGIARIVAPRAGTVAAVHVREGQSVRAGQPLLTVAVDQTAGSGRNVDADVLASLGRQRHALAASLAAEDAAGPGERRRLEARIEGLEAEIARLEAQVEAQEARAEIARGLVEAIEELRAKGYIAEVEGGKRQDAYLDQKGRVAALGADLAAKRTDLAGANADLAQLPGLTARRRHDLEARLAEIDGRIAEIEGRRAYVLRSPIDGRVATLQATVGRSVAAGGLQLSVLPENSLLQAELLVPTAAVGFVRPGQPVRVLYDAFPYQRFGAHAGRVRSVSQTILTPVDAAGPLAPDGPVYKVTVALDRQEVPVADGALPLQADMLLKADIILERRTLLRWLLDPVLAAKVS